MHESSTTTPPPTPMPRAVLCPYCGSITPGPLRCTACGGHLDALSRQATQNAMGPWAVRDARRPFHPGCSYDTLARLVEAGRLGEDAVVRGPSTGQFWMMARRVPGLAHLLGFCHACQARVKPSEYACRACGAVFEVDRDRQHLGLGPVRPLPGEAAPEIVAARASIRLPELPTPTPRVGHRTRPGPSPAAATAAPAADAGRIRTLEKRIMQLRSRLTIALSAIVVLACALAASVVIVALNRPIAPGPTARTDIAGPRSVGPQLGPAGEEPAGQDLEPDEPPTPTESVPPPAPERPAPGPEQPVPGPEQPPPGSEPGPAEDAAGAPTSETAPAEDRPVDITLLTWPDAQEYLEAAVDLNAADSLRKGLAQLDAYAAAVGLPEAGEKLREAWRFRLEQLELDGLP